EGFRRNQRAQGRDRRLVLEARHIDRGRRKALAGEFAREGLDRLEVAREINRAIEHDQRPRRAGRGGDARRLEAAEGADRRWVRRRLRRAELRRKPGEAGGHVQRAALVEVPPDFGRRLRREGRGLVEAGGGAPVARQKGELDSLFPRQRRQLVDAVAP